MHKIIALCVVIAAVIGFGLYWNKTHAVEQVVALHAALKHGTLDPDRLTAPQGSTVELDITSDEAGVIHVEDYEVFDSVTLQKPARIIFTAATSGEYMIHIHPDSTPNDEIELGRLIVR